MKISPKAIINDIDQLNIATDVLIHLCEQMLENQEIESRETYKALVKSARYINDRASALNKIHKEVAELQNETQK